MAEDPEAPKHQDPPKTLVCLILVTLENSLADFSRDFAEGFGNI